MKPDKVKLKIDWATHDAAKYACENWHYSRCVPKSKLAKFGVWEDGSFIGVLIYGVGATSDLVKSYGLRPEQGCELVRIALKNHRTPVSRLISISVKMLKKHFGNLRLIVSFADPERGHHGGVYQASGWIFSGNSQSSDEYLFQNRRWQGRAFRHRFKGMEKHPDVVIVSGSAKHRYLMPLDDDTRHRVSRLAKPYPKRAVSDTKDTADFQSAKGGSTPTTALQSTE